MDVTPDGPRLGADFGDLGVDEFRRLAHQAVDMAADYLASMRSRAVFTPMRPGERESLLDQGCRSLLARPR